MLLSIRQRLTVTYCLAIAVLMGAAGLAVMVLHSRLGISRLDRELDRLANTAATVLQHELHEGFGPRAAAENALGQVPVAGRGVLVLNRDGEVLAKRWIHADPIRPGDILPDERIATIGSPNEQWRLVSKVSAPVPAGYAVVALASLSELDADHATVRRALTIILPAALVLSAFVGWWVAGRSLRPAAVMAGQAQRITEHSTGARLTVGRRDELGQLALAFNALLDRLERALEAQRQFLADASHELRTPVSVARTAADAALMARHGSASESREALDIVSHQMKHLSRIIGDMLLLARGDADRWPLHATTFYAEELTVECVRSINLLAGERGVEISLTTGHDLQVCGDEELLRQMIGNLLENAVSHTPPGEAVLVDVAIEQETLTITVRDHGPGIAEADVVRIFDRFVRTGSSASEGTGLGLAIARRIARAHAGDLQVLTTGPDGTAFRASIPGGSQLRSSSVHVQAPTLAASSPTRPADWQPSHSA